MSGKPALNQLIDKIILYSRNSKNELKFLKYLTLTRNYCFKADAAAVDSSNRGKKSCEYTLRRKGALQAIYLYFKNVIIPGLNSSKAVMTDNQKDVILNGLVIISNSFAVDAKSRIEGQCIVPTLKTLLYNNDKEIQSRVLKCMGNLAKCDEARKIILSNGFGTRLLALLDEIKINKSSRTIEKDDEILFASIVRCIRILITDQDSTNTLLLRNNAFNSIGRIFKANLEKSLILESLRAFIALTEKIRVFPTQMVNILVKPSSYLPIINRSNSFTSLTAELQQQQQHVKDKQNSQQQQQQQEEEDQDTMNDKNYTILFKLIQLLEAHSNYEDEKILLHVLDILLNLAKSREISEYMGVLNIFQTLVNCLNSTGYNSVKNENIKIKEKVLELIHILINHVSENRYKFSICSLDILLEILKSNNYSELHLKVLSIFEHVYESSFTTLISQGILEVLHGILCEEYEFRDIEKDTLSKRIMSLDDLKFECPVHSFDCAYKPKYRCNSPSYLQIQEEMKTYLKMQEQKDGFDSSSESCEDDLLIKMYKSPSPTASLSSGYGSSSPSGHSGYSYSPGRSNHTYLSENSDDENMMSSPEQYSSPPTSPLPSMNEQNQNQVEVELDGEEEEGEIIEDNHQESQKDQEIFSPPSKKPRLCIDIEVKSDLSLLGIENESNSASLLSNVNTANIIGDKKSASKIVSILTIISRCAFLEPCPNYLTQFTPILLTILLNGKINSIIGKPKENNPLREFNNMMGIRAFRLANRILTVLALQTYFFKYFVENNVILDLFRIFYPFDETGDEIFKNYGKQIFSNIRGDSNQTMGYREGYLNREILIADCVKSENVSLLIPVFYFNKDTPSYRKYLRGSMDKIFELLESTDVIGFNRFQECIISLSSLAHTIGIDWKEYEVWRSASASGTGIPQNNDTTTTSENTQNDNDDEKVIIILDDNSETEVSKSVLTDSSPVFAAMFDGNFIEAEKKSARLRNISQNTLDSILTYLKSPVEESISQDLDLDVYFEIIEFTDQFLLEPFKEQTMKRIIQQICPDSIPKIYSKAVQDGGKIMKTLKASQFHITFILLQYLLVGHGVNLTSRCTAFYKIFNSVENSIVLGDLRAIFEYFFSKPKSY